MGHYAIPTRADREFDKLIETIIEENKDVLKKLAKV
jgi:hypothetical protein